MRRYCSEITEDGLIFIFLIASLTLGCLLHVFLLQTSELDELRVNLVVTTITVCLGLAAFYLYDKIKLLWLVLFAYLIAAFYLNLFALYFYNIDVRVTLALLKNAFILCTLFFILIRYKRCATTGIVYFIYVLIVTVISDTPLQATLGYLVNTFIPIALLLTIAKASIVNIQKGKQVTSFSFFWLITIGIFFSALAGVLFSYFIIDREIIIDQQAIKGYGHIEGLPRNWWSNINGALYPRLAGTAEDPIFFGYFCAFMSYIAFSFKKYFLGLLLISLVLFSLVKGAFLLVLLSGLCLIFFKFSKVVIKESVAGAYAFAGIVAAYIAISSVSNTSANVHVLGLLRPFNNIPNIGWVQNMLGHGAGSSGNLYKAEMQGNLSYQEWLQGGAESSFGLLFYQTGFLGLIILFSALFNIFKVLRNDAAKALWVIYWANASIQENLINLNYLAMLFATIIVLEGRSVTKHFWAYTNK